MSATTAHAGAAPAAKDGRFEPVILAFTCNWCSYRAADLAGTARMKYPPNVRLVRLMCSGRVDPAFVMRAFADGADAVVLTGCWPADCHYRIQNVKALRRFILLRRVLESMGIEPQRFQRFYASAAEGQQLAAEFDRIVEEVRALGPLDWAGRHAAYVPSATPPGAGVGEARGAAEARGAEARAAAPPPAERELAEVTA